MYIVNSITRQSTHVMLLLIYFDLSVYQHGCEPRKYGESLTGWTLPRGISQDGFTYLISVVRPTRDGV